MPYRLTKIYTRQGDKGSTKIGKRRISKDDPLVEALGAVDELNSSIGVILAFVPAQHTLISAIKCIQNDLLNCGGELYFPEHVAIKSTHVTHLEELLDQLNAKLPPLTEFLLPGGSAASAFTHQARTVCRRAERRVVSLHRSAPLANVEIIRYLNRLSDLLFVMARSFAKEAQATEELWDHQRPTAKALRNNKQRKTRDKNEIKRP